MYFIVWYGILWYGIWYGRENENIRGFRKTPLKEMQAFIYFSRKYAG